ncbi:MULTISPECIES: hypothetical protein [unclassified Leifsonia]|uniref:hypothetical protein n=1 Tax=unclassified Leifsonia TaxID=2663824 RepID=UPI00037E443B|nr:MULTISPECIES: hypothetical protein [unclassified Leifsonia]TDP99045.1 hypothetical protein AXZ95_2955 [Leifsonia sp. 115AMFTsu3.1]
MTGYSSLADLEADQDRTAFAARRRIDEADEHLGLYRSQITTLLETFYAVAERQGVTDHPGFRSRFQGVVQDTDESFLAGLQVVSELEEDFHRMSARHLDEREEFLARRQDPTAR